MLPVIAHVLEEPIVILHNQEHIYKYDPTDNSIEASTDDVVTYEYHTTSNFLLFIQINRLRLRVVIKDLNSLWWKSDQQS